MIKLSLAFAGAMALALPALAQTDAPYRQPRLTPDYPDTTGAITSGQNNTGGDLNVTISRGPTGADTYQSNSAAAGNAEQPERAVPHGSGGAGGSGNGN